MKAQSRRQSFNGSRSGWCGSVGASFLRIAVELAGVSDSWCDWQDSGVDVPSEVDPGLLDADQPTVIGLETFGGSGFFPVGAVPEIVGVAVGITVGVGVCCTTGAALGFPGFSVSGITVVFPVGALIVIVSVAGIGAFGACGVGFISVLLGATASV